MDGSGVPQPDAAMRRRVMLTSSLAVACLGRDLLPKERAAIDAALAEASRRAERARMPRRRFPTSSTHFSNPPVEAARSLRTTPDDPRRGRAGRGPRAAASGPRRLVRDVRRADDSWASARRTSGRPGSVRCVPLPSTRGAHGLRGSVAAERSPGSARNRIILVVDEAWAILSNLGVARWLQTSWKLSRALGVANIAVLHRLSDLRAVGSTGSEQVNLAEGLLADSETRVVYAQSPGEVARTGELLGLTETEADLASQFRRGMALWKVGRRSFLVEHRLAPGECAITDTDQAMHDDDVVLPMADERVGGRRHCRRRLCFRRGRVTGPDRTWLGRVGPWGHHSGARRPGLPSSWAPGTSRIWLGAQPGGWAESSRGIDLPGGALHRAATAPPAAHARWARPDLRPLVVGKATGACLPPAGRLVLGTVGRRLIATERAQSVIVIGPTQSRKTSGFAVPAIMEWEGPVIAASVKTDFLSAPSIAGACSALSGVSIPRVPPVGLGLLVPVGRLTHVAGGPPSGRSTDRGSQVVCWLDERRRFLVRHRRPNARTSSVRRRLRWRRHGRRDPLGGHPGRGRGTRPARGHRGGDCPARCRESVFGKEERQRSSIYTTVETVLEPFVGLVPSAVTGHIGNTTWAGSSHGFSSAAAPAVAQIDPAALLHGYEHALSLRSRSRPTATDAVVRVGDSPDRRVRLRSCGSSAGDHWSRRFSSCWTKRQTSPHYRISTHWQQLLRVMEFSWSLSGMTWLRSMPATDSDPPPW